MTVRTYSSRIGSVFKYSQKNLNMLIRFFFTSLQEAKCDFRVSLITYLWNVLGLTG